MDGAAGEQAEARPLFPDEVTLKIFSYLTKGELVKSAAPVCRQWRRLSYDPLLWRKVTLDGRNFQDIDQEYWRVTASRVPKLVRQLKLQRRRLIHVKKLKMDSWTFERPGDARILSALPTLAPGVTSLHLREIIFMSEEAEKQIFQMYSRQLTHISIDMCMFPTICSIHFLDHMCDAPHLTSLSLIYNRGRSRHPRSLEHSWPNLNEVYITDSPHAEEELELLSSVAGQQIKKLTVEKFDKLQPYLILPKFAQVEDLHVIGFPSDISAKRILDVLCSLENLHQLTLTRPNLFLTCSATTRLFSCPNVTRGLESFTLDDCAIFDDSCLMSMRKCTSLSRLTFTSCSRITHKGLHDLVERLTNLKSLHVEECTEVDRGLAIDQFEMSRPDVALTIIPIYW